MNTPVVYVCPYCGTEHDEGHAACCHEVSHCEPRSFAYREVETDTMLLLCRQLQASITQLDYKDFHSRNTKEWMRTARVRVQSLRGELMLRGAL